MTTDFVVPLCPSCKTLKTMCFALLCTTLPYFASVK